MKEMMGYLRNKILTGYIFNLTVNGIVMVVSGMLFNKYLVAKIAFVLSLFLFALFFILYISKINTLNSLMEKDKNELIGEYRTIDNAVFTENSVYAYSFSQIVKMKYDDIISVNHVDNVWEAARPGYKGNHKVVLKDNKNVIQIAVKDEAVAGILMNYMATKNPKIMMEHAPAVKESVQLKSLKNWQVSGRF